MERAVFKLSQETIAIVTVGLALATLIVTGDVANRAEARADRETLRAEARADRAEAQAARDALRAEARADREAWQAEMRALREDAGTDREAVGRLSGIVERMRTAVR